MGQRYEKNRNSVSENRETRRRIGKEGRILSEEFASLQELSGMIDSLDDDIVESIREQETIQVTESERLVSEQEQADAEKEKITVDINAEIDKLDAGISKLDQLRSFEFGQKAVESAEKAYRAEISQFKKLLDELDDDIAGPEGRLGGMRDDGYKFESSEGNVDLIRKLDENQMVNIRESAGNNSLFGGTYTPLKQTAQTFSMGTLGDGREVRIFDHPFSGNARSIYSQGSAFPDGPTGTCGCCASGTIINKAGGNATEHSVVSYAMSQRLCSENGGTSPDSWVGILKGAGISASNATGTSLEDLAKQVESGHGVIIGVSARAYNSDWYGEYMPGAQDGHALVLESVIRDANTGDIVSYVVTDSNGGSSSEAVVQVPKETLERAYSVMGVRRFLFGSKEGMAVVTDDVIW